MLFLYCFTQYNFFANICHNWWLALLVGPSQPTGLKDYSNLNILNIVLLILTCGLSYMAKERGNQQ